MQSAADYGWSGNFRELDDRLQGMQLRHRESWMLFHPESRVTGHYPRDEESARAVEFARLNAMLMLE